MSQALFERYKEALRRGHVAALRGRLDEAVAAYREAAAIAPDRPLPYASLGAVLRRGRRPADALAAYDAAVARGPEDEGALRGRAELHADSGRRTEAAADYEALAGVLERAGRLTDASDAARRALELAESRSRRSEVERLGSLLREAGEAGGAIEALDEALRVLDVAPPPTAAAAADDPGGPQIVAGAELIPAAAVPPPPPPDPAVLRAVADALLDDGDIATAADRLLQLAALHRSAGRYEAAMDACLALLARTPADHRLQLEIAAIQLDRGWTPLAAEKVRLLGRLAELDADETARDAVVAFAAARGLEPPATAVEAV